MRLESPSLTVPSSNHPNNSNPTGNSISNEPLVKRHKIFQLICDNIVCWRDLGRCFDIKDVDLCHIAQAQELHNDVKLIVNRILERMEQKYGHQFYKKLYDALNEADRKDIIRDLKKENLI